MRPCEFCLRERLVTIHHLIPKSTWGKKGMQRRYSKKEMRNRTIELCVDCHRCVHEFFDEKTLSKQFNTKEALLANQAIINFIEWCRRQK
jgi:hypothetical protein